MTINVDAEEGEYVYLCGSSRIRWMPIAFAKTKKGKATFKNVGIGCIYLPVKYDQFGMQQPLTEPIKIDWNSKVTFIKPNNKNRINATLFRKSPLLEYAWRVAVIMENGEFEASNDQTFKSSIKIGKVTSPADQAGEIAVPNDIGPYRYWRLRAGWLIFVKTQGWQPLSRF